MRFPGFRDRHTPVTTAADGRTVAGAAAYADPALHPDVRTVAHERDRLALERDRAAHDRERAVNDVERAEKAAYQRGLRDGVRAKRNNPILTILVLILAIFGVVVGVFAIMEGSFQGGGARVDRTLGVAAVEARDSGGELAQDAGQALQTAGAEVERDAEAAR